VKYAIAPPKSIPTMVSFATNSPRERNWLLHSPTPAAGPMAYVIWK
jgi:hypothetical protein